MAIEFSVDLGICMILKFQGQLTSLLAVVVFTQDISISVKISARQ